MVKGLNTLSAWALQNGLLAGKQVRVGSGNKESVKRCQWDRGENRARELPSLKEGFGLTRARIHRSRRKDHKLDLFMSQQ